MKPEAGLNMINHKTAQQKCLTRERFSQDSLTGKYFSQYTPDQEKGNNEIQDAFASVTCNPGLRERTTSYVLKEMLRRQKSYPSYKMKLAVSLACLILFMGSGFGGYQLYYTEAATISIDVNPSIELGINRWGKVIDETTYGKASEEVLSTVSLKHLEYEDALERLLASEAMKKYLNKGSLVSITLENRIDDEQLMSNLQACVDNTLRQCHSGVQAEYASVDGHMCQEAHSQGMSIGKYNAIKELIAADPQATLDEFKDKSMKEIKGHMEHCGHRIESGDTDDGYLEDYAKDYGGMRIDSGGRTDGSGRTDGGARTDQNNPDANPQPAENGCGRHSNCHGKHHGED